MRRPVGTLLLVLASGAMGCTPPRDRTGALPGTAHLLPACDGANGPLSAKEAIAAVSCYLPVPNAPPTVPDYALASECDPDGRCSGWVAFFLPIRGQGEYVIAYGAGATHSEVSRPDFSGFYPGSCIFSAPWADTTVIVPAALARLRSAIDAPPLPWTIFLQEGTHAPPDGGAAGCAVLWSVYIMSSQSDAGLACAYEEQFDASGAFLGANPCAVF